MPCPIATAALHATDVLLAIARFAHAKRGPECIHGSLASEFEHVE
jgi:hypothetical protein